MEIKQITMKELIENVAPETAWGPKTVLDFCKQSLKDGDEFVALNLRFMQYRIPIEEVRAYFAPVTPKFAESQVEAKPTDAPPSVWRKAVGTEKAEETED